MTSNTLSVAVSDLSETVIALLMTVMGHPERFKSFPVTVKGHPVSFKALPETVKVLPERLNALPVKEI